MLKKVIIILSSAVLIACGNNSKNEDESKINFNIQGASAISLSKSNDNAGMYRVDENGEQAPAVENATVRDFYIAKDHILVEMSDFKFYLVDKNGDKERINIHSLPLGENEQNDLIFREGNIYRYSTGKLEKINSSVPDFQIESVSGNFAVIRGNGVAQIYDTMTQKRYNIFTCNGPRIVALDSQTALIDDCLDKPLIDMTTGVRANAEIGSWNNESLYTNNGAAILSQSIFSDDDGNMPSGYQLAHVNTSGIISPIIREPLEAASGSFSNQNTVLFKTSNWYIVKELNKVSIINWPATSKTKNILNGLNIISLDVMSDQIIFLAEDSEGKQIIGKYDLNKEKLDYTEDLISAYKKIKALQ